MKKYYIILVLIIVYIFGAYLLSLDETNKYSKFLKDNTPVKFKSFVKETLFFIPYSKREIKKLKPSHLQECVKISNSVFVLSYQSVSSLRIEILSGRFD